MKQVFYHPWNYCLTINDDLIYLRSGSYSGECITCPVRSLFTVPHVSSGFDEAADCSEKCAAQGRGGHYKVHFPRGLWGLHEHDHGWRRNKNSQVSLHAEHCNMLSYSVTHSLGHILLVKYVMHIVFAPSNLGHYKGKFICFTWLWYIDLEQVVMAYKLLQYTDCNCYIQR